MDPSAHNWALECLKFWFELGFLLICLIYSFLSLIYKKIVPSSPKALENETILITGTGSGIGREMAKYFAKISPQSKLVLWDVNEAENKKTLEAVKALGVQAHAFTLDITNYAKVNETAEKVSKEVGTISILVNNAGIVGYGSILEQPADLIEKTIQVNLISHFWTLKAFLPKMIENNRSSHVMTTCSMAAFARLKDAAPYCASKFGVRGFIRSLRSDLNANPNTRGKVTFTTIYPYFVTTPLTSRVRLNMKMKHLNQFMTPEYVAKEAIEGMRRGEDQVILPRSTEPVLWLCSLLPQTFQDRLDDWIQHDSTYEK